jgi:hypothetical protein
VSGYVGTGIQSCFFSDSATEVMLLEVVWKQTEQKIETDLEACWFKDRITGVAHMAPEVEKGPQERLPGTKTR